jgi:serine/threonine protein phosphatase PrpC
VASDSSSVDKISQNLIDLALAHETDDNASVVVFHLRKLVPVSTEHESYGAKSSGWFQNLRKFVA